MGLMSRAGAATHLDTGFLTEFLKKMRIKHAGMQTVYWVSLRKSDIKAQVGALLDFRKGL
jgi:deoxycytidylate deaminase